MTTEDVYRIAREAVACLAHSNKGGFIRRDWEELLHEAFVRWLELGTIIQEGENGVRKYFMRAVVNQRSKRVRRKTYFDKYCRHVKNTVKPEVGFQYPKEHGSPLLDALDKLPDDDSDLMFRYYSRTNKKFSLLRYPDSPNVKTRSGLQTRVHRIREKLRRIMSR